MTLNLARDVAALPRLTIRELQARYAQTFGEPTNAHNRAWLVNRIAWRLQALAEGDLSERARQRAEELACDADLRLNPPRDKAAAAPSERTTTRDARFEHDGRLPPPGTILTRPYKGAVL
jgi:hypothetical protein